MQGLVPFLSAIGRSRDGSYLLLFPEWFDLVSFSVCSATTSFSIILSSLSTMTSSILPYSPISFRIVVSYLSFSLILLLLCELIESVIP